MKGTRFTAAAAVAAPIFAAALGLVAPAHADNNPPPAGDYDSSFNAQLHTYGIYTPQDYSAWLGKIACERIQRGVDGDAYKSEAFVKRNLPLHTTDGQAFQFLGAALPHYCPDQVGFLQSAGH